MLLLIPPALALDTEPNDSCPPPNAEVITPYTSGVGAVDSGDVDSYRLDGMSDGTLRVLLENLSNPDADFTLSLYNPPGTSLITSGTMSGGHAELSWSVGATVSSACLQVGSGSGTGGYHLLVDWMGTAPAATAVKNLGGTTITSASLGQQVKIVGSHLGGALANTRVTFGGAVGKVLSVATGEIRVIVPYTAADGDVVVNNSNGRSTLTGFSVGRSTPLSAFATPPDVAWYDATNEVYLNRTLVQFAPDVNGTTVTSTLNSVLAADSTMRSGWTIVSSLPNLNLVEVEWTYASTPDVDDLAAILDDLATHTAVVAADAESAGSDDTLMGYDLDMLHTNRDASGAMGQISFEEARRLFRFADLSDAPSPTVIMIDAGLVYGDSVFWPSGSAEFPPSHFTGYTHDSGWSWSEASDPTAACDDGAPSMHGNNVASVLGAWNDQQPDWIDGDERASSNSSGILASLDLALVDEDGDAAFGRDDADGEAIDYYVVSFGDACEDGSPSGDLPNAFKLASTFEAIANDPSLDGAVVSISQGLPIFRPASPLYGALDSSIRALCQGRTVVLSSGNFAEDISGGVLFETLPQRFLEICGNHAVIVGGTATSQTGGSLYPDEWWYDGTGGANYGTDVDILAPYDGWRFAAVDPTTGEPRYDTTQVGTSFATPAVSSTIALVQSLLADDGLSDLAAASIVMEGADNISSFYDAPSGDGWRLDVHRALLRVFQLTEVTTAQSRGPWLLVADRDADAVKMQAIDTDTSEFVGTSVTTVTFPSASDCDGPVDVAVDPLGDLGYALCTYSGTVAVFTLGDDAQWVDTIPLVGSVSTRGKITITPDGILRVATVSSSAVLVESFDTWSATRHLDEETFGSGVSGAYGAAVDPDGLRVAFTAYSSGTLTTYDYESVFSPHSRTKDPSDLATETWSGTRELHWIYDLDWYPDASQTVAMFNNYGSSYYSYENIAYVDPGVSTSGAEFSGACDAPIAIRVHPTDSCGRAVVGCLEASGSTSAGTVVIGSVATDPAPTFVTPDTSFTYSSGYVPTDVDLLPDGSAAAMTRYKSGGTNYVYLYGWPSASSCSPSSTTAVTLGGSGFDVMSTTFSRPVGMAVSPYLSVSSPRPGTHVYGARPMVVMIRDPRVEEIEFDWDDDGIADCVDTDVADGVSDSCVMDISAGATITCTDTSGDCDVDVTVTANLASGSSVDSYAIRVPYAEPLE